MTDIQFNLTTAIPTSRLSRPTVQHISDLFLEWRNRRRLRAVLGALSAEKLKDLGLTLTDVDTVLLLPFSRDAESELQMIGAGRSGNW